MENRTGRRPLALKAQGDAQHPESPHEILDPAGPAPGHYGWDLHQGLCSATYGAAVGPKTRAVAPVGVDGEASSPSRTAVPSACRVASAQRSCAQVARAGLS